MDGGDGTVYGGDGDGGVFLLNQRNPNSLHLDSFFSFGSSSCFLGSSSMVSFEDVCGQKRSEMSLCNSYDQDENGGDDEFEDYFHQPEKKRRLKIEQVRFLEKSFECEEKLEPERKIQLAKELGLQPRQVAIWFQNRRARWKTKRLEKNFDVLQASYDSLKDDYDNLLKEKEKLHAEVIDLMEKLHTKEKEQGDHSEVPNRHSEDAMIDSSSNSEKHNCAKSDVVDTDSTRSLGDQPGDSDVSQDEEDYLGTSLLPLSSDPMSNIDNLHQSSTCNFELTAEEDHDHASLFWPYWDINLKM